MTATAPITAVRARAYRFPTTVFEAEEPESDGTARWSVTGVLVVELDAGGRTGMGYSYTSSAALDVVVDVLAPRIIGSDPMDTGRAFWDLAAAVRNLGWAGVCACAISAVDIAMHDLKAKLLDVSLLGLLGGARPDIPAYGSGGFTDYSPSQLARQLTGWAEAGLSAVKMKVGTDAAEDPDRVRQARAAIGPGVALFVDANGAYDRKQALRMAEVFAEQRVAWFEEPVSSDDLPGLRLLRDRGPAGMPIAAGEYGYTPGYFRTMLAAEAVDVLQADATRCGGVTGFGLAVAQAEAHGVPLSAHTAPALHASLGAAFFGVVHVEYFHDHVLIEQALFEGLPELRDGCLRPDRSQPGHGLSCKSVGLDDRLVGERRLS